MMSRSLAVLLIAPLVLLGTQSVRARASDTEDVMVSGTPVLAVLDGDGDGPDEGDCFFMGTFDPNTSELMIMPTQDVNQPLRPCVATPYEGTAENGESSETFVQISFTMGPDNFMEFPATVTASESSSSDSTPARRRRRTVCRARRRSRSSRRE
jgi:hypothetical protein